jgi:hypothetical protein
MPNLKDELAKWLASLHNWACNTFDARYRAKAIDEYARKVHQITVTTTIQVSHSEFSGEVYNMKSTCHGVDYTTSWLTNS